MRSLNTSTSPLAILTSGDVHGPSLISSGLPVAEGWLGEHVVVEGVVQGRDEDELGVEVGVVKVGVLEELRQGVSRAASCIKESIGLLAISSQDAVNALYQPVVSHLGELLGEDVLEGDGEVLPLLVGEVHHTLPGLGVLRRHEGPGEDDDIRPEPATSEVRCA